MRLLFIFLTLSLVIASCKKAKKDFLPTVDNSIESVSLDASFGDNGSLVFQNINYSDLFLRDESLLLFLPKDNYLNTGNNYSITQKLALSGANKSFYGVLGYKEFDFSLGNMRMLPNDKLEAYYNNIVYSINESGYSSMIQYAFQGTIIGNLSDGKYLVSELDGLNTSKISRLKNDFTIDNSFVPTSVGAVYKFIEYNGDFYLCSFVQKKVYKINAQGGLDNTFGVGGSISFNEGYGNYCSFAIGKDGLFLSYSIDNGNRYSIKVRKFDLNGQLVSNYGNQGTVLIDGPTSDFNYFFKEIVISEKGNTYLLGTSIEFTTNPILIKISNLGEIDKTIGNNGIYKINEGSYAADMKIHKNAIYVLGNAGYNNDTRVFSFKLN